MAIYVGSVLFSLKATFFFLVDGESSSFFSSSNVSRVSSRGYFEIRALTSESYTLLVFPLKLLFTRPPPSYLLLSNDAKLLVGFFAVTNLNGLPFYLISPLIVLENLLSVLI